LDRVCAAPLGFLDALGVGSAAGRERVGHAPHEGDALLEDGERVRTDVSDGAAAHPVLALDRVAAGRRHPALASVAERDFALDRIADVVAGARLAVEEVLDLVPAHPGPSAVLVRVDGVRSLVLLDG